MQESPDTISFGNLQILPRERLVRVGSADVRLTPREFDVLEMLATHPGWVFSSDQLAGEQLLEYVSPFAVNVHVAHLRQKLAEAGAPELIATVRGAGYKLVPPRRAAEGAAPSIGTAVGTLIGRQTELAALERARADVSAGSGRIALVVGEPGIGKTALVDAAISSWPAEEIEYVRAVCDGNGSGEHWMWRQVLHDLSRRTDVGFDEVDEGSLLRAILGDGMHAPLEALSDADRTLAYDAVSRYLALVGQRCLRRVVIFVDDLHWADRSSLKLLTYASKRFVASRLLLVVTSRDPSGSDATVLAETLARVARSDAAIHLHLEGLLAEDVAQAVEQTLGRPDEELAREIAVQTDGNPLFLLETLRAIAGGGGGLLGEDGEPSSKKMPSSIAQLVREQVSTLPEDTRSFLEAASVVGVGFSPAVAADAAGLDDAPAAVQSALDATVLVDETSRLRFRHPLFRAALFGGIPMARRHVLHDAVAEAIRRRPSEPGRWVFEVAHHYSHGTGAVALRAISFLLAAARESRRRFGFEDAQVHLQRALELLDVAEIPANRKRRLRSVLLERIGANFEAVGDIDAAAETYSQAAEARLASDYLALARICTRLGSALEQKRRRGEYLRVYDMAQRCLDSVADRGIVWWRTWIELQLKHAEARQVMEMPISYEGLRAQLEGAVQSYATIPQRARYFDQLAHVRASERRWVIDEECLLDARRAREAIAACDGPQTRALIVEGYGQLLMFARQHAEADAVLEEGLELADRCEDVMTAAGCSFFLSVSGRQQRDMSRVLAYTERLESMIGRVPMPEFTSAVDGNLAWVALQRGDIDEARERAQDGLAEMCRVPECSQAQWVAAFPALVVALADGRADDALRCARMMVATTQQKLAGDVEPKLLSAIERIGAGDVDGALMLLGEAEVEARTFGYV